MHNEICVAVRDQLGNTLPLQQVSIWTDSGGVNAATIYDSATTLTAITNPTTTDGSGILHVWCDDNQLWYTTPLQQTPLRLPVISREGILNVKDYGAVGDGNTNDTAAFVAAVADQRAASEATYYIGTERQACPAIYMPGGVYVVDTDALVFDYRGAHIYGDGMNNTRILVPSDQTGNLFTLGSLTVDMAPAYPYQGAAGNGGEAYLHDFGMHHLYGDQWTRLPSAGDRRGIAIFDNACGNSQFYNLLIRGFEYGHASIYGGDFITMMNVNTFWCDIGMYFGPGSEQCWIYASNSGVCHENVVLDGCHNMNFFGFNTSTPIGEGTGVDIHIRSNEMGATNPYFGEVINRHDWTTNINFNGLWEERVFDHGADRAVSLPRAYFLIDGPAPVIDVCVSHADILMGNFVDGEAPNGTAFIELSGDTSGSRIKFEKCLFAYNCGFNPGCCFEYLVKTGGTFTSGQLLFKDCDNGLRSVNAQWPPRVTDGDWGIEFAETEFQGLAVENEAGNAYNGDNTHVMLGKVVAGMGYSNRINLYNINEDYGVELMPNYGSLLIGNFQPANGTYRSIKLNALAERLEVGDVDNGAPSVSWASAHPTGGPWTWQQGSIIFNTNCSNGDPVLGWICTSTGSPGTWKNITVTVEA